VEKKGRSPALGKQLIVNKGGEEGLRHLGRGLVNRARGEGKELDFVREDGRERRAIF